jgi:hypothetical protein
MVSSTAWRPYWQSAWRETFRNAAAKSAQNTTGCVLWAVKCVGFRLCGGHPLKKWTAAAPVMILLGVGTWMAAADNGRLAKEIASAEVESVLDAIAWTDEQRVALEDMKDSVAARLQSRFEQLQSLILGGKRVCPSQRFQLVALLEPIPTLALRLPARVTSVKLHSPKMVHAASIPSDSGARGGERCDRLKM